ncbi:MAG: hypothetical protein H2174_01535 [Vampirovibrio sp.]|nr:hypothetical protein [Vampirovibrio sp.]
MPESYSHFIHTIEKYAFIIVVLELLLIVIGGIVFRALLRTNLTLKARLLGFVTKLKQAKIASKQLNQQLQANQELLASGFLSAGKALPKPLRWFSTLLSWIA